MSPENLSMRNRIVAASLFVALAQGCGATTGEPKIETAASAPRACATAGPGVYGVKPLGNKSGKTLDLGGSDDLLLHEMQQSGCFTLVERDKLTVLVEEMRLCDEANPDKSYFDCSSFAKKGKPLGVTHMVVGDVVIAEPNIKGAQLAVKIPGLGGVELGRSYSAIAIEVRVLDVESGKLVKSSLVHAEVPADSAGVSWSSAAGLRLEASVHSSTPFGKALQSMFGQSVKQLR